MRSFKPKYTALLRAINVGGTSVIKMVDLIKAVEKAGLKDVSTYIQSGNVLFTSQESNTEKLARHMEKKLKGSIGYEDTIFVLTNAQLEKAAANNPFKPKDDKEQLCHLMFLSDKPDAAHVKALMALQDKEYRFAVKDKVFYYAYSRANAGPNRRTINFEKVLGITGTTRSWNVVEKLIELTQ